MLPGLSDLADANKIDLRVFSPEVIFGELTPTQVMRRSAHLTTARRKNAVLDRLPQEGLATDD